MKYKFLNIVPVFLFLPFFLVEDDDEIIYENTVPTGIFLDTLQNEVKLAMENDQPQYYYADIFTPVCNTGECLPVKVNIYWDLSGNYIRFNQPKGEVLTKLDHEPFTEDDYEMLHDIMSGPDPRFAGQVKHHKMDRDGDQSSPAPESVRMMTKYEMVDGITGSTLPEIEDKFVPGALYTTYTLWGLANDNSNSIRKYTMDHLMKEEYLNGLLTKREHNTSDMVINHLVNLDGNKEDSRDNILLSFLDTGSVSLQLLSLNKLYWGSYQREEVQLALHNKFYNSDDISVRRMILQRWAYNFIEESSMTQLSVNVHTNQDVIDGIIALFLNKPDWSDKVFANLAYEMDKVTPENQKKMLAMFRDHKEHLSKDQLKIVKEFEKKFK